MGSENYTLGRGELRFDKFVPNTLLGTGERYLGNTPELNLSTESERLDHFNSDRGIRVKDKSVLLEKTDSGSFIADEISAENLALWFLADVSIRTQSSAASVVENIAADQVTEGTYHQLGKSQSNPSGVRGITVASVTPDPVAAAYVLNTDYTVDEELGQIYIVPGGGIATGDPLIVTYATLANTREQVIVSTDATQIEGALRFISYNPTGPRRDYYWPYVQLSADGDLALKGDEWQQLSFTFDILKRDGYASQYIDGRPVT